MMRVPESHSMLLKVIGLAAGSVSVRPSGRVTSRGNHDFFWRGGGGGCC